MSEVRKGLSVLRLLEIVSTSDMESPRELAKTVPETLVMPQTSLYAWGHSNVFFSKGELIWDNQGHILLSTQTSTVLPGPGLLIRKPFSINGLVSSLALFKSIRMERHKVVLGRMMAKLVQEKKDACLSFESHNESVWLEGEVLSLCSQHGKANNRCAGTSS